MSSGARQKRAYGLGRPCLRLSRVQLAKKTPCRHKTMLNLGLDQSYRIARHQRTGQIAILGYLEPCVDSHWPPVASSLSRIVLQVSGRRTTIVFFSSFFTNQHTHLTSPISHLPTYCKMQYPRLATSPSSSLSQTLLHHGTGKIAIWRARLSWCL